MPSAGKPAIDVIRHEDLVRLATHRGPALSVFVPTARHGPETLHGPTRLRNLIRSVADDAEAAFGADTARLLVEPLQALVDDSAAWQRQADGLALFATTTELRQFRLPITLAVDAVVGDRFRLRPLLDSVSGDVFYLLALAQNSVRAFEATRRSIDELPSDHLPASMDDALRFEDPERQLQSQSVGGTDVRFHGHGAGKELDKQALERYFRAVDRGLVELLGPTSLPVVLACVDYYLPIYRDITNLANVVDTPVPGNPEHRSAAELHAAAAPLIEHTQEQRATAIATRYHELAGTGHTLTDLGALADAAGHGRIETLLVAGGDSTQLDAQILTLVDHVIADAIATGATITVVQPSLIPDSTVAAILRY
jgi:hypothetical protein